MAITTKLELRQTHSLVMTPQLQQAIKLLQLSNMELASFVEAELERNPLLERVEPDETAAVAGEPASEPAATPSKEEGERQESAPQGEGAGAESESGPGDGDDGDWVNLDGAGASRSDDLDAEPQDVFPDSDSFSPGALKDSGWSTLAQS